MPDWIRPKSARSPNALSSGVPDDVERTKRLMAQESDAAHAEVETFLKSGSGQSIAQVAVILAAHRTIIQGHSADLHGHVANDTLLFTNQFQANAGRRAESERRGKSGTSPDQSSDAATSSGSKVSRRPACPTGHGHGLHQADASSDGPGGSSATGAGQGLYQGRALLNRVVGR